MHIASYDDGDEDDEDDNEIQQMIGKSQQTISFQCGMIYNANACLKIWQHMKCVNVKILDKAMYNLQCLHVYTIPFCPVLVC